MDTKMKMRLARAKRTAFGRFLCRLVGAFGGTIGSAFKTMSTAIFNPGEAKDAASEGRDLRQSEIDLGDADRKNVTGQGQ